MKVVFGRKPEERLPDLFAGDAWMIAAEAWAVERGLKIEQWRVDQRFQAGGNWHRIDWTEGAAGEVGQWTVSQSQ